MEKKGLERNVVSLILAIVGIVVVIIILVKVYSLVMQDNEVKSAAKVLDNIIYFKLLNPIMDCRYR